MKRKSRKKLRRLWEKINGKIPKGFELHHITPVWEGGTDDLENLVVVSFEEHKKIHYERYLKNQAIQDLLASKIGISSDEARKLASSLGGRKGGKVQFERKIGIHFQTKEERLKLASLGGKVGAFTNSKIQSTLGKRGGKNNKGFRWFNDGEKNLKYTTKNQTIEPFEIFLIKNPSYKSGKIQPVAQCQRCKQTHSKMIIGRYHNNNCRFQNEDQSN